VPAGLQSASFTLIMFLVIANSVHFIIGGQPAAVVSVGSQFELHALGIPPRAVPALVIV
jgi:hypothetical protein